MQVTQPPVALWDGSTAMPVSSVTYNADGEAVAATDADQHVTSTSYDLLGRTLSTTNPISGTSLMTYTGTVLTAQQDPQGNVTSTTYDSDLRPFVVTNAAGQTTKNSYGAGCQISPCQVTDGNNLLVATYQYDALDRVMSQQTSAVGPVLSSYNLNGQLVRVQQANGDVNFSSYDLAGDLLSQETDTGGASTTAPSGTNSKTFSYDAAGNLVSTKDYDGHLTTLTINGAGETTQRVASYSNAQGTSLITTTQQFDADGNIKK